MIVDLAYFIGLNKVRQYIRLIKKNKFNVFIVLLLLVFFLPLSVELFQVYENFIIKWFPIALFTYSLAKVFQNNPILNIPFQTFEMKVLSLNSLKLYVFLKTVASSVFITAILLVLETDFTPILYLSLMANSLANYLGFIKYQISTIKLYSFLSISILVILFSVQASNCWPSMILFLAMAIHLILTKSFKYDYLYSYYRIMGTMFQGIINQDFSQITSAQDELLKNNKASKHKIMEKHYDSMFFTAKEMTRVYFNLKGFLNICIFTFIIGFISYFYIESQMVHLGLFITNLVLVETFLTKLNRTEFATITTGFFLPINLVTIIKQKWLSQALIVLFPLITGFYIFGNMNPLALLIVVPLIPLRNIIFNFTNSKLVKIAMYVLGVAIFGSLYFLP